AVPPGLRALVLRIHGERRGREPPLRFRLPQPGLEALRWIGATEVDTAIGVHHRPFDQEVRVHEVTAGAAEEPGIDAVSERIGGAQRGVIAALGIKRELVQVPLRFGADQSMTRRADEPEISASVTDSGEHSEQVLLRIAPAPVTTDQITV